MTEAGKGDEGCIGHAFDALLCASVKGASFDLEIQLVNRSESAKALGKVKGFDS